MTTDPSEHFFQNFNKLLTRILFKLATNDMQLLESFEISQIFYNVTKIAWNTIDQC